MENIPYQLSKDYNQLFELVKAGNRIVVFVDYDMQDGKEPCRDVATLSNFTYYPSARGISYNIRFIFHDTPDEEKWKRFLENCHHSNLEFVIPNAVNYLNNPHN